MTNTQQKIINYLKEQGETTKKVLYDNCSEGYYNNGMFHFGNILSNMVNKGMIERVHKGVFAIPIKHIEPVNIGLFKE